MPIKYFKKKEQYQERFYQLPKVFFTNEIYKKLSLEAKVAYSILRDRLELSLQNDWVDSEENIYFIYTNENLMEILNLGKNKVVKIKKELESVNLLRQKRLGLNKPNMLYLIKPEVTEDDIYKIQNEEKTNKSTDDKEVYKTNFWKFVRQTLMILSLMIRMIYIISKVSPTLYFIQIIQIINLKHLILYLNKKKHVMNYKSSLNT